MKGAIEEAKLQGVDGAQAIIENAECLVVNEKVIAKEIYELVPNRINDWEGFPKIDKHWNNRPSHYNIPKILRNRR